MIFASRERILSLYFLVDVLDITHIRGEGFDLSFVNIRG